MTRPDPASSPAIACSSPDAAQRVVLQARAALDTWRRAREASGLTQQACLVALQRVGGQAAVDQVRRNAAQALQAIDDQAARDVMHRPGTLLPRTRRHLLRGGV